MKKKEYSFIDFLISIVDDVINPKQESVSPYDINFTNHYKALYNVEETLEKDYKTKVEIKNIVQDKKSKTITANSNITIDKFKKDEIKSFLDENNIDYKLTNGKIKNITIGKQSKGVIDERKWKENDVK